MGGGDVISPRQMRLYIETPTPALDNKKSTDDENLGKKSFSTELIPDAAILSDHGVKNDAVLYLTFAESWESGNVSEGDDGWEEMDIF